LRQVRRLRDDLFHKLPGTAGHDVTKAASELCHHIRHGLNGSRAGMCDCTPAFGSQTRVINVDLRFHPGFQSC
jgi:hypothetical protein